MAKQEITKESIIKEIDAGQFRPVYYLMGDEPYYIDTIAGYIAAHVLTDEERDFDQTIVYGNETDIYSIITQARRYPMMSRRQVIIVKEAQNLKELDQLASYLQKPLRSTLLVFCHKNGSLDRRRKIAALIEKQGILFESKKIREAQLPQFITRYLGERKVGIDNKSCALLAEYVGTDLSRLTGELEKLIITLPEGNRNVTAAQIEQHIGISKDYNNFELRSALIEKDVFKANSIVKYFEENPKSNPIQVTLSLLFSFFSNLMLAYYAPQKNEQGVAAQLSLRSPWQAREYITAMQHYSGVKVMSIISEIRLADARSKGVGNSSQTGGDILRELVYKILH